MLADSQYIGGRYRVATTLTKMVIVADREKGCIYRKLLATGTYGRVGVLLEG